MIDLYTGQLSLMTRQTHEEMVFLWDDLHPRPDYFANQSPPPQWEAAGLCGDELLIQPLPEYKFDQRIPW